MRSLKKKGLAKTFFAKPSLTLITVQLVSVSTTSIEACLRTRGAIVCHSTLFVRAHRIQDRLVGDTEPWAERVFLELFLPMHPPGT